jgi:hypothetical protein
MERFLRQQGFEVIPLYNRQATKAAIISKMQSNLAPRLRQQDRVLVFFAGHGYTERLAGQNFGYIVPYDGTGDAATYISMEELQAQSRKLGAAKHQLFIMDACYGGLLGTRSGGVDETHPAYLEEVTKRKTRQILTAGGKDQQVVDGGPGGYSVFTGYLLRALQESLADGNGDGYITFAEMTGYLVPAATNTYQTPASFTLPGHEGGEFVFRSPRGTPRPVAKKTTPALASIRRGPTTDMVLIRAAQPFLIGRYEVTFEQYDRFALTTGLEIPDDKGWGRGKRPVINVSWDDAVAYVQWLSQKTGKHYRLPTEAEWEYAAGAGTKTAYWWGKDIRQDDKVWANCNGCGSQWDGKQTAPVGSFPANPFGLHDTAGNVGEWVQDCDTKDEGRCSTRRIFHGGSWFGPPRHMDSAARTWVFRGTQYGDVGFRLAQDP